MQIKHTMHETGNFLQQHHSISNSYIKKYQEIQASDKKEYQKHISISLQIPTNKFFGFNNFLPLNDCP